MAIIDHKLHRLGIDIAAIQEARLPDTESMHETNYTLYSHGKSNDVRREHGKGFAVSNRLLQSLEIPTVKSECLTSLHINRIH